MPNVNDVGDRATKWIRWIARIWGTLIVAFTLLMLIGYAWNWVTTGKADPHAVEDYPPIETLPPLFALLSVLGLGVAWRWEGLGGAITVVGCGSQIHFCDHPKVYSTTARRGDGPARRGSSRGG